MRIVRFLFREVVQPLLGLFGLALERTDSPRLRATMPRMLQSLGARRLDIRTVIDIGASNGRWSGMAMAYLGDARFLLVEAQAVHRAELDAFCSRNPRAGYVLAAAGDSVGQVYFDARDPLGGRAAPAPQSDGDVLLPSTTLDHECRTRGLPGPYLLKFDTHGFEVSILRGASSVLAETAAIVMECYNYRISPDCLTFDEMCAHMRGLGFRCIDLADPLYRPGDDSLWQMDLLFVRSDRPEFSNLVYE